MWFAGFLPFHRTAAAGQISKSATAGFTEADFYPPIVGKDRLFESRFETSRGTYLPPVIEGVYPDTVQTATMAHEGVRGAVYHTHLKPRRID